MISRKNFHVFLI